MKKTAENIPVNLTITGKEEEADAIVLRTQGILVRDTHGWMVRYNEFDPFTADMTQTIFRCEKGRVTASRTGSMATTVIFSPGELYTCNYETPAGTLNMQVFTIGIDARKRGATGRIRLSYQLTSGDYRAAHVLEASFTPRRS